MTQFPPRSFLLKNEVQGFYLRLPFQLATPSGFHATHIPKGDLVFSTKWGQNQFGKKISRTSSGERTNIEWETIIQNSSEKVSRVTTCRGLWTIP